jgi:serine protein kinase
LEILRELNEYRNKGKQLKWEGSFTDYLQLVIKNPHIAQLSHYRIYKMIKSHGITEPNGRKRYLFFNKEIFGLEKAIEILVEEYFHPAARRLDVRKRILLLMGPVSGGKSTIVTMLKRGMEQYSGTEEGALYGIKGCPMHEEPLHLIPKELRKQFEQEHNIFIEGELCPWCRINLENNYNNDVSKVIVERITLSEEKRLGIGTFTPSDPKSQDIAELTGSIDFSTITEYGSESSVPFRWRVKYFQ